MLLVTATQRPRLRQGTKKATAAEEDRESKQRQTSNTQGGPVTTGWPGRTSPSDLSNGLGPECAGLAGRPFIRSYGSTPPTRPTLGFSTRHSACLGLGVAGPSASLEPTAGPKAGHHWPPTPMPAGWPGSCASSLTTDQHLNAALWQLPGHFILISYPSRWGQSAVLAGSQFHRIQGEQARGPCWGSGPPPGEREEEGIRPEGIDWAIFPQAGGLEESMTLIQIFPVSHPILPVHVSGATPG